ncbi:MAG TPA: (2Fe-2S)-binding protein [Usitatibacter sp.]
MAESVAFILNGRPAQATAKGSTPLVYVLRGEMGLMGARIGCGEGHCGSCTVIVDGKAVTSCDLPLEAVAGKSVETVEGIARDGRPHPVQQAIIDEQAGQCGYCLTGIVMRAKVLLDSNPAPTRREIASALDGHLCRCGAQPRILRAIARAATAIAAAK